ncbi:MAG TPA: hypothetical protein VHM90_22195 [Phycisphaerae bacterium]|nr:hypothetical protein [Phycisphaerae bacterium]
MGHGLPNKRWAGFLAAGVMGLGMALPLPGASRPLATRPAASHPATVAAHSATRPAGRAAVSGTAHPASPSAPALVRTNPLLPPAIGLDGFYADTSLIAKLPAMAPLGFEPLYTSQDWVSFRERFGAEADAITHLRSSGQIAFAEKLIEGANPAASPGLRRLLLTRAAAIAYRSKEGFPTADKAVQGYFAILDRKSPAQVGALWTLANTMARTSVTPKPDRIRYDGVAARANMQLALLLLDADQIDAAQAMIKQVAYHEGWLKGDAYTRGQIAQVRSLVKQQAGMMEYLATQYQPAIHNDVAALTAVYLYGRYVKQNIALVADLPGRVPESSLALLAQKLDGAAHGNMDATFAAAESLRVTAAAIPDAHIRSRTLYAAMQLYDAYMASPSTEKNRIQRTLARINREAVVSDGARRGNPIDPFAPAPATTTAPGAPLRPVEPAALGAP